jgi:hypothetical protein
MKNNKYTTSEEESYWFLRWICMRYERNKLKKELQELKSVEWVKVHKENLQLKKTLEEIKKDYQPIKTKIHNGHNKKRIR